MKELMQKLREASLEAVAGAQSMELLEEMRVRYLGKKGELTGILRQMGSSPTSCAATLKARSSSAGRS